MTTKTILQTGAPFCGQNAVKKLLNDNYKDIEFVRGGIHLVSVKNPYWWYTSMRRRMHDFRIKPIDINYFALWGHQNAWYMDILKSGSKGTYIRAESLLSKEDTYHAISYISRKFKLTPKDEFVFPTAYKNLNFAVYQEYMKFYRTEDLEIIARILHDFEPVMNFFQYGIAHP